MLQEGDYYHLVEASDINLACTPGQNWDYGLFRSTSLTDTDWEQYPRGNSIVYSSKGETDDFTMCNVQYAGLIRDPDSGFVYMKFGRRSAEPEYDAIHWYRLETSANRLTNATLWRADSHGWSATGEVTNVSVYRHPNETPDGTQYMAVDCGGSCDGTHSVYQDVAVPSDAGDELEYGGMFMSEGEQGALTVATHQLDGDDDDVVRTDRLPIETGPKWATYGTSAPLDAASETVHYEFQLDSDRSYRATDMYIRYSGGGT